LVSTAVTWRG